MTDVLIALGAITLIAIMAIGSGILGILVAKWLIWLWDRR
ncbi:hypothetical protein EBESD8_52010 [Rhodococcus aetherivorans]|nr:hypothetical protein EBESD8_52010 [Rhodococcus aetherivorans]